MAATLVDLDTLMAAIALCRTATQTQTSDEAVGQEHKPAGKGKHASSAGCDGDDATDRASSDEEWVEADPTAALSDRDRRREVQLLEDIKHSVEKLPRQVVALKKRQQSNDKSASSMKDKESEKVVLSGMFPPTGCKHEAKLFYGNQFGHGVKCADCNIKVFRQKNSDISIKVPR
jgi:hypothetical protein